MFRLLRIGGFLSIICLCLVCGAPVRADSTVRFQLEIIPVEDPDTSDKDKDKDNDDDDEDFEAGGVAPIGGPLPGYQEPSTPLEVIISKITPETVVASRFPSTSRSWCTLTLSRSLPVYIMLNILVLTGLFLWVIGLWWLLPRRSICLNGHTFIYKRKKDDVALKIKK